MLSPRVRWSDLLASTVCIYSFYQFIRNRAFRKREETDDQRRKSDFLSYHDIQYRLDQYRLDHSRPIYIYLTYSLNLDKLLALRVTNGARLWWITRLNMPADWTKIKIFLV